MSIREIQIDLYEHLPFMQFQKKDLPHQVKDNMYTQWHLSELEQLKYLVNDHLDTVKTSIPVPWFWDIGITCI